MYNHVYVRHFQLNRAVKKSPTTDVKKATIVIWSFSFEKKKLDHATSLDTYMIQV